MKAKKPFNSKKFQQAKSEWYEKLRKDGFNDLEATENSSFVRPVVVTSQTQKRKYHGGFDYYRWCNEVLERYQFKKDIHKKIFWLHTEGKSDRLIAKWIKTNTVLRLHYSTINRIINRIKAEFLEG